MVDTVTLVNGKCMPMLGLGTYRMRNEDELRPVIHSALRHGYRLIDSATVYRNETAIGRILKEVLEDPSFGLKRSDLFVTSKLSPQQQGYESSLAAVEQSLERLGLDYIDLYLIHWPGTSKTKLSDPINQQNRRESYRALEELYRQGKVRNIGISNYTVKHLSDLLANCTVKPHVHQFELHPRLVQTDIISLCSEHGIQVQAYSSLGEGQLLQPEAVPGLSLIAERHGVSPAQVLLRWAIQHGWPVIPKSSSPERVKANSELFSFTLSPEDMTMLDNVHKSHTQRFCWDPTEVH